MIAPGPHDVTYPANALIWVDLGTGKRHPVASIRHPLGRTDIYPVTQPEADATGRLLSANSRMTRWVIHDVQADLLPIHCTSHHRAIAAVSDWHRALSKGEVIPTQMTSVLMWAQQHVARYPREIRMTREVMWPRAEWDSSRSGAGVSQ